jgi:hypothetical protein
MSSILGEANFDDLERTMDDLGVVELLSKRSKRAWKVALVAERHQGVAQGEEGAPFASVLYSAVLDLIRRQKGGA